MQEAQQLAEIKTRAEMRLGELTAAMPKGAGRPAKNSAARAQNLETKQEALSKVNIRKQQASQYELMASNPEIVEQAIKWKRASNSTRLNVRTRKALRAYLIFKRYNFMLVYF